MHMFARIRYRSARRIWASGIALVLIALSAAPALACTQPPGGHPVYTIAQRVQAADVVLEGTITQVTSANFNYTATIAVLRYFKGSGPATATITNFGTGADCRSVVQAGDHWIFFANGDPNAELSASYLSAGDALATPADDTIAQIVAAVNSRPRAYLPLLASAAADIAPAAPSSAGDRDLIGLALVAAGIVAAWLRLAAR
jgi:hypothetical protein